MFGNLFNGNRGQQAPIGQYKNGNRQLIELDRVEKRYETSAGEFTALKGIDLTIDKGEFVTVVGKSGSGKSTLVNMITDQDLAVTGPVNAGNHRRTCRRQAGG